MTEQQSLAYRVRRLSISHALGGLRHSLMPYFYLAPALFFIGLFVLWPVVRTFYYSLYNGNLLNPYREYVGVGRYVDLLTDSRFHQILMQSGYYLLFVLAGAFVLPIFLAILTLNVTDREIALFQSVFFLPTVIAANIAVSIWIWFYNPTGGLFNALLESAGIEPVVWLRNSSTVIPAVALVAVWKQMGFHYLIALAGLKAIPNDLIEAAAVDGAGNWTITRRVILPLFGPSALFLFVITLIQGLEFTFVPIEVLTGGGPAGASSNLMYSIYQEGFKSFRIGVASAQSVVLIVLFGGLAYVQYRMLERNVHYDR